MEARTGIAKASQPYISQPVPTLSQKVTVKVTVNNYVIEHLKNIEGLTSALPLKS